jgi:hypothetical protein
MSFARCSGVAPVLFGSLPHRPIGPGVVDRRCHECIGSDLAPRELLMQAYLAWKVFEIEAQIMTPILEGRNDIQNHSRIGVSVGFSDQYGLGSTVFFRKLLRRHGLISIRFAKLAVQTFACRSPAKLTDAGACMKLPPLLILTIIGLLSSSFIIQ